MSENQLCWECKRATGLCPWSHSLRPIKGWEATKEPDGSYEITKCPLFKKDDKVKILSKDLQKLLHITNIGRYAKGRLKDLAREIGYELFIFPPMPGIAFTEYYIRKIKQENNNDKKQ